MRVQFKFIIVAKPIDFDWFEVVVVFFRLFSLDSIFVDILCSILFLE